MTFQIFNDIDSKMIKSFATFLNDNKPTKNNRIEIFLNSNGGDIDHCGALFKMINDRKDDIKITAYGVIYSAAFELYVLAECEKTILPNTKGMYHRSSRLINMTSAGTPKDADDEINLKSLIADEANTIKVCDIAKMSDDAKAVIFSNKEAYFTYEELKEMLM